MVGADTRRAPRPLKVVKRSAAQPAAHTKVYIVAFYNIGWLKASKKWCHTKEILADEIYDLIQAKCVDAVGISEVFNLREDQYATQPLEPMRLSAL